MKKVIFLFLFSLSFISCSKSEFPTESITEWENHITAKYKFNNVEAYIKSEDKDLSLKSVTSNSIDYNGFSKSWGYKYSNNLDSTFTSKYYYVSAFYNSICCDSIIISETKVGDAFISKSWLNSDKIMAVKNSEIIIKIIIYQQY